LWCRLVQFDLRAHLLDLRGLSPWRANAAVCEPAFIKIAALRQSQLPSPDLNLTFPVKVAASIENDPGTLASFAGSAKHS
jgi:hypothetical protein